MNPCSVSGERVVIGLGSNMGDRETSIRAAFEALSQIEGTTLVRRSGVHETRPFGGDDQPPFLNAAAELSTTLSPERFLEELHLIENRLGRTRNKRWGPRTIDLDILFYGNRCIETPDLHIPHPGIPERAFVLNPMAELIPDFVHPVTHRTVLDMLHDLNQECHAKSHAAH